MALRVAACGLFSRRAAGAAKGHVRSIASSAVERRAFMSTSSEIFAAPSFPVKSANGFEGTDPAVWLQKYAKADPADMWAVGSFPVQDAMAAGSSSVNAVADEELWDTSGMLSALADAVPLRNTDARGVDEMLREMDRTYGYYADSVLKKRRKKMNKHKHRKRKKALRMRTKAN